MKWKQCKMADSCFIIFCGIPASGKSTLAKELIHKDWKIRGKFVHFIYINYDDFIPENLPVEGTTLSIKWKAKRREILKGIEELLLAKSDISSDALNVKSRLCENSFVSSWCPCGGNLTTRSGNILHMLVIDDNMFYRSMRYEYYQLARKTSLSFAQIYLHCPVELAIARNAQRSVSVDENTIRKMYHRIENPDPGKFSWETFSITVDHSMGSDDKWKTIIGLLKNATASVAPPLKLLDDLQKAKDRAISEKSIVHQLDQVLRKHISHKLEELRVKNHSKDILTREAATWNRHRKSIMELVKKDPRVITNRVNILRLDVDPVKDSLSESTVNKTNDFEENTDESYSVISSTGIPRLSGERVVDESFLLENFWDVVSREEFGDIARGIFEQT